jgi:hypothetical protein
MSISQVDGSFDREGGGNSNGNAATPTGAKEAAELEGREAGEAMKSANEQQRNSEYTKRAIQQALAEETKGGAGEEEDEVDLFDPHAAEAAAQVLKERAERVAKRKKSGNNKKGPSAAKAFVAPHPKGLALAGLWPLGKGGGGGQSAQKPTGQSVSGGLRWDALPRPWERGVSLAVLEKFATEAVVPGSSTEEVCASVRSRIAAAKSVLRDRGDAARAFGDARRDRVRRGGRQHGAGGARGVGDPPTCL